MAMCTVDTEQEVLKILEIIGLKVLPAVEEAGATISQPARHWWLNHYARTFFFAKIVLGRDWATDEPNVLDKARELGRRAHAAAVLAGHAEIEVADAKLASMHVDCGLWKSEAGTLGPLYRWC